MIWVGRGKFRSKRYGKTDYSNESLKDMEVVWTSVTEILATSTRHRGPIIPFLVYNLIRSINTMKIINKSDWFVHELDFTITLLIRFCSLFQVRLRTITHSFLQQISLICYNFLFSLNFVSFGKLGVMNKIWISFLCA